MRCVCAAADGTGVCAEGVTMCVVCVQLLMALACVLRVQEAAAWSLPSTNNAFKGLLDFALHKKHRVGRL